MNSATNGLVLIIFVIPTLTFIAYQIGRLSVRTDRMCYLLASIERVLTRWIEAEIENLPPHAVKMRQALREAKENGHT